ncbi:MAG: hypothetical protein QOI47_1738, partial [Actinomycetota bacterium]|nr:hypothetical protein [Actinomycetota bacterium]
AQVQAALAAAAVRIVGGGVLLQLTG